MIKKVPRKEKHVKRHLIIPDCQVRPGDDLSYLYWIGQYIVDKKPDVIIHLGDFADMPSLSSYDVGKKSFEGRTYTADIEAANIGMSMLLSPIASYNIKQVANKKKQYSPRMVLVLGNHEARIDRAVELDRKLEGLISIGDLKYKEFGWEVFPFLTPVFIDGICYCHYLCSGSMGKPISAAHLILQKKHNSCVVGHQQGRDVAYSHKADGSQITAIICGSCYMHDESYLNAQTNNHWRGIIMLNEVKDGVFDECFVSLNYLERKYGSKNNQSNSNKE